MQSREHHYLTHTEQHPTFSIPHKIETMVFEDGHEEIIGGNVTCMECILTFAKMKERGIEAD